MAKITLNGFNAMQASEKKATTEFSKMTPKNEPAKINATATEKEIWGAGRAVNGIMEKTHIIKEENVPPVWQWQKRADEKAISNPIDMPYQAQDINLITGGTIYDCSQLIGMKILDLGAGSTETPKYRPETCEALEAAGAVVVGVDIGQMKKMPFLSFGNVDLSKKGALDGLPPGVFEVINMRLLIGIDNYSSTCPQIWELEESRQGTLYEMEIELFEQANRLLKEKGYFIADETVYQKIGGELNKLGKISKIRKEKAGRQYQEGNREPRLED